MSSDNGSPGLIEMSEAKRLLLARRMKGLSALRQEEDQIHPRPAGAKTPISVDQYRIWLHASMQPDLPTYNEPILVKYKGDFKLDVLKASLDYFIQRHEALRTTFEVVNEEVLQLIHPEVHVNLEFFDLSDLPVEEREATAHRLATQQAVRPIAVDKAPLFRTMVVRAGAEDSRLYMVLHHIIFDGLSIQETFIPELAAIYAALEAGRDPALPARTLQYCDYAAWRQQQVNSPAMERLVDYWRTQLAGELPLMRLPTDRPRPAVISQRGEIECFMISGELTGRLRTLSHAHGVTLFMTLLAAFKVMLFRYSGQEDVIVGASTDGRRKSELRGMMGYILDTLAVRTRPMAATPFSTYLGEVKHSVLGGMGASEVPFDRVVQAIGVKRDLSYHPIFQTFFSFLAPGGHHPKGWDMGSKTVNGGASKFDIYFEVEEQPTYTPCCIIYNSDLFDAATIHRMQGHWITLLEAVCRTPDALLGELPMLTEGELRQMLVTWNETAVPVPETTMHGLVAAQTELTPDRIAVEFEGRRWTYAELDQHAERLATHLRRAGAGPKTLVALCIDRSEYMLASLLAILKTGAAYLPLDPRTPQSRIELCLEDAEPAVLLTHESLAASLPVGKSKMLLLEDIMNAPVPLETGADVIDTHTGPSDSAYVIHTSGSTGRPKAVELSHGGAVNLLLSMKLELGFSADDALVAVSTISFDIATLEMFMPLIAGGRVVIASRAIAVDPYKLVAFMDECGCTVMQATPATWRALMAIDWRGRPGLRALSGGEPLTRDLAEKLLRTGLELWNGYGPTETTIYSTTHRVRHGNGPVAIGRPLANTTTYILDASEQPVPVGVMGELYIGGIGLAEGYRGQPEMTAQKFVQPAVAKGERLYRTGDYALYRANGIIECLGRVDNQVKIRGHRIELEEVELHLSAHPQLAAVASRTWADPAGGYRISAYVVSKSGKMPSVGELREFLKNRLPEYMIPSDFTELAALPLTPNGKTDRKALPIPSQSAPVKSLAEFPLTPEETKMSRIWSEVLDVPNVGRDDNFFDLGGHSLLLVILFARINKEFASHLPITTIFDAQTLAELARTLKENTRISSLVPVQPQGSKPPLFMAHSYLLYRSLSRALGMDQPFYGLRELEQDGGLSIEDRALRYIADMRTVQPHGPYRIAGWCAAGPLAVEIARQLLLGGERVALLELFDAWLPDYVERLVREEKSKSRTRILKTKLARFNEKTHGFSLRQHIQLVWRLFTREVKETRDRFYINHWGRMNQLSEKLGVPLPQFMHNTTLQTFAAMRQFRAATMPVRITLIRAAESRQVTGGSNGCGWEEVAELGVDVLWAPGDHETMFRGANLEVTAKLVTQSLENVSSAADRRLLTRASA